MLQSEHLKGRGSDDDNKGDDDNCNRTTKN